MMKPITDDKATGKLHELKGTIKETVGVVTDNPELEADGKPRRTPAKFKTG